MAMTLRQQHNIRNAIVNYKAFRRKMFKNIAAQVNLVKAMDTQIIRIQQALNGEIPPSKWKRIINAIRTKTL